MRALTPRQQELKKKELCKIFKENNLQITVEANLKIVDFLDVTLDLNTMLHKPYMKPNDRPLYTKQPSTQNSKEHPHAQKAKTQQHLSKRRTLKPSKTTLPRYKWPQLQTGV